ncbi:MAG: LysR family transcriptional regulator [Verrucomicrobiales bacterium]
MSMNIHHLELFYYVARHGGISEAVRNIPYGIQQPAISSQIAQLETSLGVSLFQRRPFCLTPAGDKLYSFIQPFFQNLEAVAEEVRGNKAEQIRIGASEVVLKNYLPELMQRVRAKFPNIKMTLREGYQNDLVGWLKKQELDLALTLLLDKPEPHIESLRLLELPMVLLVSRKSKIKSPEDLWRQERIQEPLLCLPSTEMMCKQFQEGLKKLKVHWTPSMELSSLQLIEAYVIQGYGVGLSLLTPKITFSKQVRIFCLDDFPKIDFGILWQGNLTPFMQTLVHEVQSLAMSITCPEESKPSGEAKQIDLADE